MFQGVEKISIQIIFKEIKLGTLTHILRTTKTITNNRDF